MNTIQTSKTTQSIIDYVFKQPQWQEVFGFYKDTKQIDLKDLATLHIIADQTVKAIPYGLKDKESESRYKGNLTRFQNDSTVQAIQDKYPSIKFDLHYEGTFAASVFVRVSVKTV